MTSRARLLGALITLVTAIAGLHALGAWAGLSLGEWSTWSDNPGDAVIGGLRLLALALSYYLFLVVVTVAIFGDRIHKHPVASMIPFGVMAALGLVAGVSALTAAADSPAVTADQGPAPLILERSEAPLTLDLAAEPAAIEPQVYNDARDSSAAQLADDDTWIVKSGESFWSVAEETLQDAWGVDQLTDDEVVSYWKPLIAANEDRLVDPGNPDLLLPEQELVLPPTPVRAPEGP